METGTEEIGTFMVGVGREKQTRKREKEGKTQEKYQGSSYGSGIGSRGVWSTPGASWGADLSDNRKIIHLTVLTTSVKICGKEC